MFIAKYQTIAVAGITTVAQTLETGRSDRRKNMIAFAGAAITLLIQEIALS